MHQHTTDNKDAGSTVNEQSLVVAAVPGSDSPIVVEADQVRHTPNKTIIWMSESESDMIDLVVSERDVEARSPVAQAVLAGASDNDADTREDAHADENRIMTDGGIFEDVTTPLDDTPFSYLVLTDGIELTDERHGKPDTATIYRFTPPRGHGEDVIVGESGECLDAADPKLKSNTYWTAVVCDYCEEYLLYHGHGDNVPDKCPACGNEGER